MSRCRRRDGHGLDVAVGDAGERADADDPCVHGYGDGQDSGGDCPMRRLARQKKWSHRPKQMERHGDLGTLPDFSILLVNELAGALNGKHRDVGSRAGVIPHAILASVPNPRLPGPQSA